MWAKRMQAERWLGAQPGDLVWCTRGDGLGEVDLERPARPVERGARDRPARGRLRPRGALPADRRARRDRPLPGADRVPADGEARRARPLRPVGGAPRRLGRRAAEPGGDQCLRGRVRHDDPRRLRPDGEHAARRQRAGRRDPAGLDGPAVARARRRRDRRGRMRAARRRRGGHRARADGRRACSAGTTTRPRRRPPCSAASGTSRATARRATRTATSGSRAGRTT